MRVWLALGTVYLVWGSTFLAVAVAVRDLPPLFSMAVRHLVAGALLLAWALPRGDRAGDRVGLAQVKAGLLFGGALFLVGHGALAWAQQTIPSGLAALTAASIPLWMALIDRVVFGSRLAARAVAGLVLGFVGLSFLFDPLGSGSIDRVGAMVAIVGAAAWAVGSLYSRGASLPRRPLVAAGLGSFCGGALLLVASTLGGELADVRLAVSSLLAIGYLVVFGTLIAFSAYVWLLRVAPLSLVGTYAYVNPVVAVLLGWALLGERVTLPMLAAAVAIVVSVAMIVSARAEEREPGRRLRLRRPGLGRAPSP